MHNSFFKYELKVNCISFTSAWRSGATATASPYIPRHRIRSWKSNRPLYSQPPRTSPPSSSRLIKILVRRALCSVTPASKRTAYRCQIGRCALTLSGSLSDRTKSRMTPITNHTIAFHSFDGFPSIRRHPAAFKCICMNDVVHTTINFKLPYFHRSMRS